MTTIQIVLIVAIFIITLGVGIAFVLNQESQKKKRTMALIQGRASHGDKKISQEDAQNKRRAEIAKKLKESKQQDGKKKKKATLSVLIGQAGINISAKQYLIFSVISMIVTTLLAKTMGMNLIIVIMAAIIGFFGIPRFVLRHLAKRRQKKFLSEFPDALEAVIRLLKAGMPVAEAVSMISREFGGPVGEEMSRIYDKQKIGIPLHEAAMEATLRMPLQEVRMFATGLAIQAQTGSSLSEVLQNLSSVIRARFKLKRKIKALSSEAIASAGIIGSLPILLTLGMYFANREYIMILFTDPFGKILLAGAVIWMGIGILMMKIMINFKI